MTLENFLKFLRSHPEYRWYLDEQCIRASNPDYDLPFCPLSVYETNRQGRFVSVDDAEDSAVEGGMERFLAREIASAADRPIFIETRQALLAACFPQPTLAEKLK